MAYYNINGVDIRDLYETTSFAPRVDMTGYKLVTGSYMNEYNAVYNGGWGPDYAFDPSGYNYQGKDILNLNRLAPKNTIIQIEHDANDKSVATSCLDLGIQALDSGNKRTYSEYYVTFIPRRSRTQPNTLKIEWLDLSHAKTHLIHNGSVDKDYILIRLVGGGGYGYCVEEKYDFDAFSGGGGATFFGLMRPSETTFAIRVGRGGRNVNDEYDGTSSQISLMGIDDASVLVEVEGGIRGKPPTGIRRAGVIIRNDDIYEYFRPVCTSEYVKQSSLPSDRTKWPMFWGKSGGEPGRGLDPAGHYDTNPIYVSNCTKGDYGKLYAEHETALYAPPVYVTERSGTQQYACSGASSFCGRGARHPWTSEPNDLQVLVFLAQIKNGRKKLKDLFAETGGGGGGLLEGTKFYQILKEHNAKERFLNGGDGKLSFFW